MLRLWIRYLKLKFSSENINRKQMFDYGTYIGWKLDAHVRSNLCYLICLRHLLRSRAVMNRIFSPKRPMFVHACATSSELPSNISTVGSMVGYNKQRGLLNFYISYYSNQVYDHIIWNERITNVFLSFILLI